MKTIIKYFVIIILSLLITALVYSQGTLITKNLKSRILKSTDTTIHKVFVVFKDRKIFSNEEKALMNTMLESDRQTFYLRTVKNFVKEKSKNVLNAVKPFESSGKARLLFDLWSANAISINATKEVIEAISQMPEVEKISLVKSAPVENFIDRRGSNTYLREISTIVDTSWGVKKIRAPDVWNLGLTGQNTVVAIIDMGFDYNHPDLSDHRWNEGNPNQLYYDWHNIGVKDPDEMYIEHYGYDVFNDDNNPIHEVSNEAHGTQCAGIVAGDGTNGRLTGVAPDAKLMFIRCLSASGNAYEDDILGAVQWIHNMIERWGNLFIKPNVISMSVSCKFSAYLPDPPNYAEWRQLCYHNFVLGITHCNSIGNDGGSTSGGCNEHNEPYGHPLPYNIAAPGNVPPAWLHPDQIKPLSCFQTRDKNVNSVLGVGETWTDDNITGQSGLGPAAWEDIQPTYPCQNPQVDYYDYRYNRNYDCDWIPGFQNPLIKPDVTAPGYVTTLLPNGYYTSTDGFGGTSAATPHVAQVQSL